MTSVPEASPRLRQVRELLAGHRAADRVEQAHLARTRALVAAPGDPFDRDREDPGHITASAFVLHPARSHIALVAHLVLGRWVQPGGHVEPEDAGVEAAAVREVREETGLEALEPLGLLDVDVHPYPARHHTGPHLHHDLRFGFRSSRRLLRAGEGTGAVGWVPVERVLSLDPSLARAALKLSRLVW